jgi:hypothetical protein
MARSKRTTRAGGASHGSYAIDRWPRGIACDKGFRLIGTHLGFGLAEGSGLRFLPHVDSVPPARGSRILATPLCAAAIDAEGRGLDVLGLGFGRRIRLGRMDLCLYPAGLGPGSAMLEIVLQERRIAFCGGARLAQPLDAPSVDVPRCDLLLVDVAAADPRPPAPRRASNALAEWVTARTSAGQVPVVACGTFAAALDAAWTVERLGIPVRACRTAFEMLRRVEPHRRVIEGLRRLEQEWPSAGVVLHMAHLWPASQFALDVRLEVSYAGPGRDVPPWASASFRLGESEDRPGLLELAKASGASEVALGPGCDEATAEFLGKAGLTIYKVHKPTQILLPL